MTSAGKAHWPVHVYADATLPPALAQVADTILTTLRASLPTGAPDLHSLLPGSAADPPPSTTEWQPPGGWTPHFSLMRAGHWLPRAQLDAFVSGVWSALAGDRAGALQLGLVASLVNDTATRRFVVLEATAGYPALARSARRIDGVLARFHRPEFYETPRFHVSIAWTVVGESDDEAWWTEVCERMSREHGAELRMALVPYETVHVVAGHQRHRIDLAR
ncbi:poly(U)-specific 3'-to-5' RNA exonuclease [Blastocladiella emersonii ATCC 22665]|nr:poly(U)-specific 3'-to-5' RNA exonuclease [Blastocladiella emersonii ATCC 22665]